MHIHKRRTKITRLVTLGLLLVAAILVSFPSHSIAVGQGRCKIYVRDHLSSAPIPVQTAMNEKGDRAGYACIDGAGTLSLYARTTEPVLGDFDVCDFEVDIPPEPAPGGGISSEQELSFMALAPQGCPSQDSDQYAGVNGVSKGGFASLMEFSKNFLSSKDAFISSIIKKRSKLAPQEVYEQILSDFFGENGDTRPTVRQIGLGRSIIPDQRFRYNMIITVPNNRSQRWDVKVDFTPTGLKILGFDHIID